MNVFWGVLSLLIAPLGFFLFGFGFEGWLFFIASSVVGAVSTLFGLRIN